MTRLLPCEICAIVAALALGCGGVSRAERSELTAIERSLSQIASAPPEDRLVLLDELAKIAVTQPRTREIKNLCYEAYREFDKTARLLEDAKAQMAQTEKAIADARSKQAGGTDISSAEAKQLIEKSSVAGVSLQKLNRSLEIAERSIGECKERREKLRASLIGQ